MQKENAMRRVRRFVAVALVFLSTQSHVAAQEGFDADSLRENVEHLREQWKVPGVSLGIVRSGDVVFMEGFGVRDIESKAPFTPDTLIRVASTTKSFTAALVGQLVDDGVVEWDRPVREYHPDFQMVDEFATAEMTLEDMMCHRSGLPWHENLLVAGVGRELTGSPRGFREDLIRRLRFFEPSHSFRTHFQYQDVIFTCVGGVLERVTDTSYESLVKERLLKPLGMGQSTLSRQVAKKTGKLSRSYAETDGNVARMDFIDTSYIAPSAGLHSNARDMARWVAFNLANGRVDDRQLVSQKSMAWVHRSHMVVGAVPSFKSKDVTYGQGWFRSQHRGRLLISHGGSFNGHRTTIAFIPELDLGAVVLCNLNLTEFPELLVRVVFDRFLGVEAIDDWNQHYVRLKKARQKWKHEQRDGYLAARRPKVKPSHKLSAYVGVYTHPGYGTFAVTMHAEGLEQAYDGRSFPLEPYNGDTFGTRWQSTENNLLRLTMRFHSDKEGHVVAVEVPLIPGIPPQRFVRQ